MNWLDIVLQGVSSLVSQWVSASAEEKVQIEARAISAINELVTEQKSTAADHAERTAETQAEISKPRG